MIMGLFGGTIFPLAMGYASDAVGQAGAVAVMTVGVIYLMYYTLKSKKYKNLKSYSSNMKDVVVGMGEALWDVLPEGKKLAELPQTSHITCRSLASRE